MKRKEKVSSFVCRNCNQARLKMIEKLVGECPRCEAINRITIIRKGQKKPKVKVNRTDKNQRFVSKIRDYIVR